MKSLNGKRKNLTRGHILGDRILIGHMLSNQNEASLQVMAALHENKNQFKIPKPFRVWCHPCNQGFKNIEELQTHSKNDPKHDRNKEAYLNVKA